MAICCCQAVQRLSIVSKLLGDEIVARTRLAARDTAQVSVSSARARASVCSHRYKIPIFSSRCEKQGELYHTTNIIQRFSVEVGRLSYLYYVKPLKSIKI